MMGDAAKQQCDCPDCVCMVEKTTAIEKNGEYFCSDSCANGHTDGPGCGHTGCGCKG